MNNFLHVATITHRIQQVDGSLSNANITLRLTYQQHTLSHVGLYSLNTFYLSHIQQVDGSLLCTDIMFRSFYFTDKYNTIQTQ